MKDTRLKTWHDIHQEGEQRKYNELFDNNPFTGNLQVLSWLKSQLLLAMQAGDETRKVPFEMVTSNDPIRKHLGDGDLFYSGLLHTEEWLPRKPKTEKAYDTFDTEESEPPQDEVEISESPFSNEIRKIYNRIWKIDERWPKSKLWIYHVLNRYLQQSFGTVTGKDAHFSSLAQWHKIFTVTNDLHHFFGSWITSIDRAVIIENFDALTQISHGDPDSLGKMMGRMIDMYEGLQAYASKIASLESLPDWEYVSQTTHSAEYISFSETITLNESLVLQLDPKHWLAWVDKLHWPILQAHALYSVSDLSWYKEAIGLIAGGGLNFTTKRERLLLLFLDRYFEILQAISLNLDSHKEGKFYPTNDALKEDIMTWAKAEYDTWMNAELAQCCKDIFDTIFSQDDMMGSIFFTGILDLLNNQPREGMAHGNNKIGIKVFDLIQDTFNDKLCADKKSKSILFDLIKTENTNWTAINRLYAVYLSDKTAPLFRDTLFKRYKDYLQSAQFNWNDIEQYSNEVINQAYGLSCLIAAYPSPYEKWTEIYLSHKVHHEGWLISSRSDYKIRRKEIYCLVAGIGLAHFYYKENQKNEAGKIYRNLLDITIAQSRKERNCDTAKDYCIPMLFIADTITQYAPENINNFVERIIKETDNIEVVLMVCNLLIAAMNDKGQLLAGEISGLILARLKEEFWIIEKRYRDPGLSGRLKEYTNQYKVILDAIKS